MTGFHSFCRTSISAGGGVDLAEDAEISDAEEAFEVERERPSEVIGDPAGAAIGTESTIVWPFVKASLSRV